MFHYLFATESDMEDVLDFLNMVFSMEERPHRFDRLLPKAYAPEYRVPEINAMAVENGRICGVAAVYPYDIHMGDQSLKAGYVGSVSVHPRMRGQGVMQNLMQMQIQHAREQGIEALFLSGQRQRYSYFGFASAGVTYTYTLSQATVRHAWKNKDASVWSFKEMTQEHAEPLFTLYEKQPFHGMRTRDSFLAALRSFEGQPWTIYRKKEIFGYAVSSADGMRITEIVLKDETDLPAVLKAWLIRKGMDSIELDLAPWHHQAQSLLSPVCEWWNLSPNGMILCLRPERVIEKYMRFQNQLKPLSEGECRIGYGDRGTLLMKVQGGEITCRWSEEQPDCCYAEIEAQELLFGYHCPAVPKPLSLPHDWLPLPVHIPQPDTF